MRALLPSLVLSISFLALGCGGSDPETTPAADDAATDTEPTAAEAPTPAPASNNSEVSVDDIDRWQRGMQAEFKAVQEAAAKLANAKDENEKLEALFAANEMGTVEAGANGAGVDPDRYRRIRNQFSAAVSQLSPLEMEMDVTQMPEEMVEQMQQSRDAAAAQLEGQLPADVFEALKTRAAELRQQQKLLVAERLKVANNAR